MLRQVKTNKQNSYVIRGINNLLLPFFNQAHFDKIIFGKEAVLDFSVNHFDKKSLQELIKRGLRKGNIIEVTRDNQSIKKLAELSKNSTHGNEPQLKHLFLTEFTEGTRLFVFENKDKQWLGGILVSINSPNKFHTELMLRDKNAPVGVMEALIFKAFKSLQKSGKEEFSLGEVPFVVDIPITKSFYRDVILNKVAKFFRFAYNYKGLYDFKNKFNPRWDEVFICGYPKLKLSHIAGIIIKSNLLYLIIHKIKKRILG